MTEMRTAMRVVAAQKPIGGSTIAMWETVDDEVELAHDVIQRSFKWCNYNSAMCWIGPRAALTDAEIASARTVANEPLGALMWLKGDEVIKAHDIWRLNDKVRSFGWRFALHAKLTIWYRSADRPADMRLYTTLCSHSYQI